MCLGRYMNLECTQCPTEKICQKSFKLPCHPPYCRKAAVVADDQMTKQFHSRLSTKDEI